MQDQRVILLIVQNISLIRYLQHLLSPVGYVVHVAKDGSEGWLLACDILPDLILLDINTPVIDGLRLLSLLKHTQLTETIPVIMLIALNRIDDIKHAIDLGANGYLFQEDYASNYQDRHNIFEDPQETFLLINQYTPCKTA